MAAAAQKTPPGENLTPLLAKSSCYCLNELPSKPWTNLITGDRSTPGCTSDADEQLLLHLALNQTVKLTALTIGLPKDSPDSCPRTVRLFANCESLGFTDAAERPATQEFTITDPSQEEFVFVLAAVKWQRCDSISIFVVDNHGDDATALQTISVYGTTISGTNVAAIKKGG